MTWKIPATGPWRVVVDYLQIVGGALLLAVGINMFFVPNRLVSGGVTGIAIMLHHAFGTPVGLATLAMNVPLLWLGWRYAGGARFFVRTLVAVSVMSVAIDVLAPVIPTPTTDRLLVIVYGGLLDGLGLGLVFRGRGTTGGADVIARIANRMLGIGIGQALLSVNLAVFAVAAVLFGAEPVMISLALTFVSARTLDTVLTGFSVSRQAMIITADPMGVRDAIYTHLRRGVTLIDAVGGFSGERRPMLYVVVASHEVGRLKLRVAEVDPRAFVAISSAQEVLGEGFGAPSTADA